ncbi:MAG: glycoside hydrolase family 13 [Candidatus Omnitrophica bacterium]|nr:glycoside hydrolase family 13 [Candidatus Omnitrophota bacterium]
MARLLGSKPTEFRIHAPKARRVTLAGSFNNWNTRSLSARRDPQGNWIAKASLKPGKYEYKFFVDGNWVNDPNSHWAVTNNFGTQNNVVEIK